MSDRSSGPVSTPIRLAVTTTAVTGFLLSTLSVSADWTRFHGDAANSGFVDVVTLPAGKGSVTVPGLGTFAPGVGPVIGPDGAVYLGTEQGKLIQIHGLGNSDWSSELPRVFGGTPKIVASAAIGGDGSIYVIGVVTVREHKGGTTITRHISELHKFRPNGDHVWRAPLPPGELGRGGQASGPPNIWQSSGTEVVMVSAAYALGVTRLFAFSTDGVILAETIVSRFSPTSSGSLDACQLPIHFSCFSAPPNLKPPDPADRLPDNLVRPAPGPAVVRVAAGPPLVIVADQFHDVVGFSFAPTSGFSERFRVHERARVMRSSPMLLSDGHSAVGTVYVDPDHPGQGGGGAVVFAGPNADKLTTVTGVSPVLATPTRLADNRFVIVELRSDGSAVSVLKRVAVPPGRVQVLSRMPLSGQSIAAAAASRTHVFVSTAGAFHTFNVGTMTEVGRLSWVGGGVSPPAIGPRGDVYAIASNILFIFPAPEGFGS